MPNALSSQTRTVGPAKLEVRSGGSGRPIVFLHPGIGFRRSDAFLQSLMTLGHVVAPAHPGFEGSGDHPSITSVDDISYLYLDLLEQLGEPALVVGSSMGGWIALETAVKSSEHIAGLVLLDAVGLRFNNRTDADFMDLYATDSDEIGKRLFHDPQHAAIDYPNRPVAELETIARNREAEVRFCWSPYMHSPHLAARIHRAKAPSLVLWGEYDGLAPISYGRQLADLLPQATFETIGKAGHFPHIEQPDAVIASIQRFLQSLPAKASTVRQKELAR